MRRTLLAAFFAAACALTGYAQQVSIQGNETPQHWFVELSSPPLADGGTLVAVHNDKQAFRQTANKPALFFRRCLLTTTCLIKENDGILFAVGQ